MDAPGELVRLDWIARREVEAWQRRPFARTFDLISSEYGWSDDQILDLTMARMRQVREVIMERQGEARRQALADKQNELQILASFIASSAGHKDGVAAAKKISLLAEPEAKAAQPIPYSTARRWFGG